MKLALLILFCVVCASCATSSENEQTQIDRAEVNRLVQENEGPVHNPPPPRLRKHNRKKHRDTDGVDRSLASRSTNLDFTEGK